MIYKIFIYNQGKYEELPKLYNRDELYIALDLLIYLKHTEEVIIQIYDEDMTYIGTFMQCVENQEEYERFKDILKQEHTRIKK